MSPLITKARDFAKHAHRFQKRKYTGEPYFVHLEEVAMIVKSVDGDDAMVAAAYLHDVVEDTDVMIYEIRDIFGSDVAQLVDALTDVSKPEDGNRAKRKQLDREHLQNASERAQTIKLADLISNSRDIKQNDPDFAKVYLKEKAELLKVMTKGNAELYAEAQRYIAD